MQDRYLFLLKPLCHLRDTITLYIERKKPGTTQKSLM